jgi:hypothetical protein
MDEICCELGIVATALSPDLFDDELRVSLDQELLVWQNQPELHRLKCADPFLEGSKDSTAFQMV